MCGAEVVEATVAGSECDLKEPECSVETLEAAPFVVVGLEEVVGLLCGLDEGTSGVRRTVGEHLGEVAFRLVPQLLLPLITFILLLLLLLLLLCPFSCMEFLGGDSLRSELLSESLRHISYGLKLDLGAAGEEPADEEDGDDFSRCFSSFSLGVRVALAAADSLPI